MKKELLIIMLFIEVGLFGQNDQDSIATKLGYIIQEDWGNGYEGGTCLFFLPIKDEYHFNALKHKSGMVFLFKSKRIIDYTPTMYNCYLNDGFAFSEFSYDSYCCEKIRYSDLIIKDSVKAKNYDKTRERMINNVTQDYFVTGKVYNLKGTKYEIRICKAKITYCLCYYESDELKRGVKRGYLRNYESIAFNQEDINKMKIFFDEVFKVQKKVDRTRWEKLPNKENSYEPD